MPDQLPILYSFRRCPYAMRARMAIYYAQQELELREVVLKNKPKSLLASSPKGTVPVLILENGHVIDESIDIMLWALAINDPDQWLNNIEEQSHLIALNDHSFKAKLDKYKYAVGYPEHTEKEHRESCYDFLECLEKHLQKHRFLFSENYRLADIAIFPFIRQFAHVDIDWFNNSPWDNVKRWVDQIKNMSLFNHIMKKYPAWKEGDQITYFP